MVKNRGQWQVVWSLLRFCLLCGMDQRPVYELVYGLPVSKKRENFLLTLRTVGRRVSYRVIWFRLVFKYRELPIDSVVARLVSVVVAEVVRVISSVHRNEYHPF